MKAQEIGDHLKDFQVHGTSKEETEYLGIATAMEVLPEHIVFVKNKKFFEKVKEYDLSKGTIGLIFEEKFFKKAEDEILKHLDGHLVSTVKSVDESISRLSRPFYDKKNKDRNDIVDGRQMGTAEVHPSALISQNVFLGEGVQIHGNVTIHAGCTVLAGSIIGEGTVLFPNVTIYRDTIIGKNCRIHSGTVIGSDGFGYNFVNGQHLKVWHCGGTEIGDDVEIGSNSSVDMGAFLPTRIGTGTKIDNCVQVGHNCQLGKHVILCGQAGMGGSADLGDYTVVGGRAMIGPDAKVGAQCQVAGNAGVTTNWPDGSVLGGFPATPIKEWLRGLAFVRKESLRGK